MGGANMSHMQQMMGGGSAEGADLKNKADAEIDRILQEQYDRGMKLLTENRDALDEIAKVLIEKEKIDGKELLNVIKSINPELVSEKAILSLHQLNEGFEAIDMLSISTKQLYQMICRT